MIVSPEIHVPAGLDRDGQEHFRMRVEGLLNRLTSEAEAWAASGRHKRGEYALLPGPIQPWRIRSYEPALICPVTEADPTAAAESKADAA